MQLRVVSAQYLYIQGIKGSERKFDKKLLKLHQGQGKSTEVFYLLIQPCQMSKDESSKFEILDPSFNL